MNGISFFIKFFIFFVVVMILGSAHADSYVGIVTDFSRLPGSKHFVISHKDRTTSVLIYPETKLRHGDQIFFPEGAGPSAWVEVKVGHKDVKIKPADSPWSAPTDENSAFDTAYLAMSKLFRSVFSGRPKVRYTQAMSRGKDIISRIVFPFSIRNSTQIIYYNGEQPIFFWVGGRRPFRMKVVAGNDTKEIHNLDAENLYLDGKIIRIAKLPLVRRNGQIHYILTDSKGFTASFDVNFSKHRETIERMLMHLDNQLLANGCLASRRLMLWNALEGFPNDSTRRAMLRAVLISPEQYQMENTDSEQRKRHQLALQSMRCH